MQRGLGEKMREWQLKVPHHLLLTAAETRSLLAEAQAGDIYAKEKLVQSNLRLVFSVVKRFSNRGREMDDLFQVGTIGLLKAVANFDASYEVCFSTYAVPMIMGEIRRYIRDDDAVSISRSLKETAAVVKKRHEELQKETGREFSLRELADSLDMEQETVVRALEAVQPLCSIYEVVYQDNGDQVYMLDSLSGKEDDTENLNKLFLEGLISKLPERLAAIIHLRYMEDKTQAEIAEIMGISQVQVSRLEKTALISIRSMIQEGEKGQVIK